MENYSIKYMETHCIDVFFFYGEYPIHILTAGGIIPEKLNDILRNRTMQEEIERRSSDAELLDFSINGDYVQSLIDRHNAVLEEYLNIGQFQNISEFNIEQGREQILAYFHLYAGLGFYSYDCCKVKEDGTSIYRMVAWPNEMKHIDFELPYFSPKIIELGSNETPLPEYFEM